MGNHGYYQQLAKNVGVHHYSAGDWIAAHRPERPDAPMSHVRDVEMIRDRISKDVKSGGARFLVEGFPQALRHGLLFAPYVGPHCMNFALNRS